MASVWHNIVKSLENGLMCSFLTGIGRIASTLCLSRELMKVNLQEGGIDKLYLPTV